MLSKSDIHELKNIFFVRFDSIDKRFEQMDKRFEEIENRFILLDVEINGIKETMEEMNKKIEDNNKRIMDVQDVVVRMDKYINGELQVHFVSIDEKWRNLDTRIERVEGV